MELNQSATPEEEEESSNNTSSSDEMFSFPGTPSTSDFEFGCVTPTSPNTNPENANHHVSPADQFFLNGRLLPHSFQPTTTTQSSRTSISDVVAPVNNFIPIRSTSLTTSRTSSIRSKEDSLMSSRSNSTSSSRSSSGMTTTTSVSCSSSARTSSSDLSERRAFQSRMVMSGREKVKIGSYNECIKRGGCSNHHRCRGYGSTGSQRWQFNFIISPVPVLDPCSLSMRRRSGCCCENGKKVMIKRKNKEVTLNVAAGSGSAAAAAGGACDGRKSTTENGGSWSGFWERSLRSFVKRCKSCHAMDQADVDDRDDEDDDGVVTSRNMEVK